MNADTLAKIRTEVEKIERDQGFGKVLVSIENGHVQMIQATTTILTKKLDNHKEKVV